MEGLVPAPKSEDAGIFQKLFGLIDSGDQAAVLESLDQQFGGDPNVADEAGTTPLLVAAKEGKVEIVQALMEKKADLMMADVDGDNPLMVAIAQGHMEIVNNFMAADDRGMDLDASNKIGQTPLIKAAKKANIECVKMLLAAKCNPNGKTKDGKTALIQAVEINSLESATELLKAGADISLADDLGFTALFPAAFRCNVPMLELLLSSKANAAAKAKPGTALMMAVEAPSFKPDAVKLLVEHGCPLDEVSADGDTALMKAVEENNTDGVAALLAARADSTKKNQEGKTALDLAKERGLKALEELLAGAP
ncbi:ANKRD50 [Symbiodinium pilosum]|uniref:ANKRD50 protein n=1 Tax=Symbiodinium pilosum TaxID=2952 RepID=A0A812UC87_SYMPI|nr:ANKRD50 [Symbiodinium pilosum]